MDLGDGFVPKRLPKWKHKIRKSSASDERSFSSSRLRRAMSVPALNTLHESGSAPSLPDFASFKQSLIDQVESLEDLIEKNSSKLCGHKLHCVQNALYKGLFRTYASAYIFKTSLDFSRYLIAGKLKWGSILTKIYFSEDTVRFSLFCGLASFIYKATLCTLRHLTKSNASILNAIAGFVAGFAANLDNPRRRATMAMYCFVRATADMLRVLWMRWELPVMRHTDIAAFTITQIPIMYSFLKAPHLMDRSYYKWILQMGNIKESLFKLSHRSPSGGMYRLPHEPWIKCKWHHIRLPILGWEYDGCLSTNFLDWFFGITRGMRIYLPVHVLPGLLFTPKNVFKDPINFIYRKCYNIIRSSLFITSYQIGMKSTCCLVHNTLGVDPWWEGALGGIPAGLSIAFEHSKRRIELLLYCIPRALEVCMRLVPKHSAWGRILRSRQLSVFSFQISLAMWMYAIAVSGFDSKNMNSMNLTVLRVIFGSRH